MRFSSTEEKKEHYLRREFSYGNYEQAYALPDDVDHDKIRIVRIANSLKVEHILLSEAYYDEVKNNPDFTIESEPQEMDFDDRGNLKDLGKIF